MTALWIFLGGGLGSLARWALDSGVQNLTTHSSLGRFPLGILLCNVLGCFFIGCLFGHFTHRTAPDWVFPFFATGFLGGFTTFSTFAHHSHTLWQSDHPFLALTKITLSVIFGLAAVVAGIKLTHLR